jgi:LmbE family N-acetylglucosaminyl deacetylase
VPEQLRLLCVLAHPDDESLGFGGTLAKYGNEGIETYLVTATRGQRGRFGSGTEFPGFAAVGRMREAELLAAAKELGLGEVRFLDYMDGELDQAKPAEIIAKIVAELRRVQPQIVLTFGPEGGYGHPDHIAICQFATAAAFCAADPSYTAADLAIPPHRVSKLYYMAWSHAK